MGVSPRGRGRMNADDGAWWAMGILIGFIVAAVLAAALTPPPGPTPSKTVASKRECVEPVTVWNPLIQGGFGAAAATVYRVTADDGDVIVVDRDTYDGAEVGKTLRHHGWSRR